MDKPSNVSRKKPKSTSGIRLTDTQEAALADIYARTNIKVGTLKKIAIDWFIAYVKKQNAIVIPLGELPEDLKSEKSDAPADAERAGRQAARAELHGDA